ncbi:adaptor protein MecA [Edaphobacillus lindanitolerans]|uniref:Adapter protein MecA n=1 Tax=Edaphobacillus lindanitolerans TaxID=550447 RepID=A0A1U7PLX9_9BACI|nr:adaptor protein MecA [Edaphobacillus lindanitolerans]SIT68801.1 adapter protein MecA 1/2 [Edaphobacillus lindanitolerans]
MEIERINENTVKFFISYIDIEERGFTRDEIWYNRDRSEELFWEMMEEVDDEADFAIEGPLWIQVHAMDKGLEVTVTKAQVTRDGKQLEPPFGSEDRKRMYGQDESSYADLNDLDYMPEFRQEEDEWADATFLIGEFDDLIPLSQVLNGELLRTSLYLFEESYYLHIGFDDLPGDESELEDINSILLEYAQRSNVTIHRLEEYGKVIIADDVFGTIAEHFG